ncbi:MAG: hypothetical protein D6754_16835 [Alphaproteobacteria bacterium]|nr:MAG: hypothetical protein D6754_16835 [Alphaproteobacteria bacterium]
MFDTAHPRDATVTAVLGPTNTGKTHYAIERMLGHRTGVIGLPLRLLAREVYDRIVGLRGPSVVALVTGEERIVPPRTQYWVCTVEAMPQEIGADFLAVDEIQLCTDPERGHVFTDRLLFARGLQETLFLGSETMRSRIAALIPKARFQRRDRFSRLSYAGSRKISRLPGRSAVVGFSVDQVYAIAELMRRQRGGAAVVMGALSPRTRNAQVALYQNGDVDYMVATDAIGMGLNLDVRHVAFAGLTKFDGHRHRQLHPGELAQIAGRAGRYENDGTFGVTGEAGALDPETIEAIEQHRFAPVQRLQWRNSTLDFASPEALIASLDQPPATRDLVRVREADDLAALRHLAADPAIRARLRGPEDVRRLWQVCSVPDFRKLGATEHAALLTRIYRFLDSRTGCIPSDWLGGQLARIDRVDGDIDAISRRLAHVRTWTYVAQRSGWVAEEDRWRGETRAVEDRLSDALHARLTQRFVDRRTSVLVRRLKQKERLVAEVSATGEVTAEGQFMGRLEGFLFSPDPDASPEEVKTLRAAGQQALQVEFARRADRFYNAPDPEIGLTEQGGLMWGEHAVGRLAAGPDPYAPEVIAFVDEDADPQVRDKVTRRLTHWINRRIATQFEPLIAMRDDETITGLARGVAFQLVEAMGVIPREKIAGELKALDQEARSQLRKHGVRFGQYTLFQTAVLKPAPTQLRLVLWGLASALEEFPEAPPPGLVTIPAANGVPEGYYTQAGYRLAGSRAIRIDMLERLADMIRSRDTRNGFEAVPDMLSITGLSLEDFAELMRGLGYRAERGERPRQRPGPAVAPDGVETTDGAQPGGVDKSSAAADDRRVEAANAAEAEASVAPGDAPVIAESPPPGDAAAPAPETAVADDGSAVVSEPQAQETGSGGDAEPASESQTEAEAASGPVTEPTEDPDASASSTPAEAPPEIEVFYTFRWGGGQRRNGTRHRGARRYRATEAAGTAEPKARRPAKPGERKEAGGNGRPRPALESGKPPPGKPPRRKGKPDGKSAGKRERREGGPGSPRTFTAAPPRKEAEIDPDNPFAALMALKQKRD